jgi:hypothetical protein
LQQLKTSFQFRSWEEGKDMDFCGAHLSWTPVRTSTCPCASTSRTSSPFY